MSRKRSTSSGLTNTPIFQNFTSRDELSYPYLNVYYNFDSKDWNRIRENDQRISAIRRRLSLLKHQLFNDVDRINRFMDIQRNLAINARGKLFQKVLGKNVLPVKEGRKPLEPVRFHDQISNEIPLDDYYSKQLSTS